MSNKAKIKINGRELTVNLSYTTQCVFVDFRGCFTKGYNGYDYDGMLEDYANYLLKMAKKYKD